MFRIINHSSFFFQMSTKRKNRGKVQCQECEFVLISDQQETHQRTKHAGQKVKFQIFPGDSKQRKVSAMFSAPPIHCAHPWRRIQDYRLHHRGQGVLWQMAPSATWPTPPSLPPTSSTPTASSACLPKTLLARASLPWVPTWWKCRSCLTARPRSLCEVCKTSVSAWARLSVWRQRCLADPSHYITFMISVWDFQRISYQIGFSIKKIVFVISVQGKDLS